jgi:hypothetical protein
MSPEHDPKLLTDLSTFQPIMTSDLALSLSLLRRGANGAQILEILETITNDIEQAGIDDVAAHYAAISAPTLQEVQF